MDETEIRQRIIEFQNVGRTVSLFTAFPDICCCYACAYLCKCIPDWLMGVPHQWKISSIPHHKPVVYYRQTPPESERGKDSHWWVGTNRVFRCRAVASLHLLSMRSNFRQQRGFKKMHRQIRLRNDWPCCVKQPRRRGECCYWNTLWARTHLILRGHRVSAERGRESQSLSKESNWIWLELRIS